VTGKKVQNAPSIMAQNHQYEQRPKRCRRYGEEVYGHKVFGVIFEECATCMRGWSSISDHVLRDRRLRDIQAEVQL
jgi:hypothetical protein